MKLLLTSTGLANEKVRNFFIDQFDRLDDKTACVVTSGRNDEEQFYVNESIKELEALGIKVTEINIAKKNEFPNLPEFDIYYVCGGNTFYILDRMKKTGIDKVLIEAVKKNKFYLGVSAGSVMAGPDIESSELGDPNDIKLMDLSGFKFVPFIIIAHYDKKNKKDCEDFINKRNGETVIPLTDNQAVFADKNGYEIIE